MGHVGPGRDNVANALTADPQNLLAASWAAIVAGGVAIAALSLVLLASGASMGFATVSPWSNFMRVVGNV